MKSKKWSVERTGCEHRTIPIEEREHEMIIIHQRLFAGCVLGDQDDVGDGNASANWSIVVHAPQFVANGLQRHLMTPVSAFLANRDKLRRIS